MPRLTADQRSFCAWLGIDGGRLWSLHRALQAARERGLVGMFGSHVSVVESDPVDVALIVGFRQGVEYERKQWLKIGQHQIDSYKRQLENKP